MLIFRNIQIKKEDHEKVKITFEGKFLPYRKW